MAIIGLIGIPGAGKTTIANAIVSDKRYKNISHISSGNVARKLANSKDIASLSNGEMFDEDRMRRAMHTEIYEALYHGHDVLLDGFPRTYDQIDWLKQMFGNNISLIIVGTTREVAKNRLMARGRFDDTREIINKRIDRDMRFVEEVADRFKGVYIVNGDGIQFDVTNAVANTIDEILEG